MKKHYLPVVAIILATLTLTSCGVPQEDYDQVVSDLAAAQNEIARLETELAAAEAKNTNTQNELDALETEYKDLDTVCQEVAAINESLRDEYDAQSAFLDEKADDINSGNVYKAVLIEGMIPAITGDLLTDSETIAAIGQYVEESGDPELKGKYDAWAANPGDKILAAEMLGHALLKLEDLVFD